MSSLWPTFDRQMLADYCRNHHASRLSAFVGEEAAAKDHHILGGVATERILSRGSLDRSAPLAATAVRLVTGHVVTRRVAGAAKEPLAWVATTSCGGRVSCTMLCHREDSQLPA